MGSPTKRNPKDQVMIKPREQKKSGQGSVASSDLSCPAQFSIKLKSELKSSAGAIVVLRKKDDILSIFYGGQFLKALSSRMDKIVSKCLASGVTYEGVIEVRTNNVYALFKRTT